MKTNRTACAAVLAAGVLWGMIGLWNRTLMAAGLSPTGIVALRNFCGMALLSALCAARGGKEFRIRRDQLRWFFATGVVSVMLFTVCYFSCQRLCSLAVASVLLYTAPAFVVILSALTGEEKLGGKKLSALALCLVGCACVCGVFRGGQSVSLPGLLLGLGAGFFYALYTIFGRRALRSGCGAMTVTLWTFLFAGTASLLFVRPAEFAAAFTEPKSWLCAAALAALSTVLPYLLYTWGLSRVENGRAAILASIEPVAAALTGVLAFGEPLGGMTLLGTALVLAGGIILG